MSKTNTKPPPPPKKKIQTPTDIKYRANIGTKFRMQKFLQTITFNSPVSWSYTHWPAGISLLMDSHSLVQQKQVTLRSSHPPFSAFGSLLAERWRKDWVGRIIREGKGPMQECTPACKMPFLWKNKWFKDVKLATDSTAKLLRIF